jgi:hypothetical protein
MSDQGDVIHSITVGSSSIEFLLRGQLYLVAVSSRGEAQLALRRQLELLYQSILMVATGGGVRARQLGRCWKTQVHSQVLEHPSAAAGSQQQTSQ